MTKKKRKIYLNGGTTNGGKAGERVRENKVGVRRRGGKGGGAQIMQGDVECEGHEECAREHAEQGGQRVGLLPALHAAAAC